MARSCPVLCPVAIEPAAARQGEAGASAAAETAVTSASFLRLARASQSLVLACCG